MFYVLSELLLSFMGRTKRIFYNFFQTYNRLYIHNSPASNKEHNVEFPSKLQSCICQPVINSHGIMMCVACDQPPDEDLLDLAAFTCPLHTNSQFVLLQSEEMYLG